MICYWSVLDLRQINVQTNTRSLESHRGQSVDILTFSQKSPRELERYIDTELSKHRIRMTNDARREFRIRINNSTTMFHIAMDSILLYGEKDLNLEDIEHLVYINPEVNHWKLGNCFIAGDAEGTFWPCRNA